MQRIQQTILPPSCPETRPTLSLPNVRKLPPGLTLSLSLVSINICCFNQPFPLSDPHRSNLKAKLQEDDSLLSLEIPPHPQPPVCMECQSLARMTLPAVKTRELLCFTHPPRTVYPSTSIFSAPDLPPSTNGYHNGGGPAKDYFSSDRFSQQSHLSSTLRPGSSRSTASPSVPHSSPYPQDDADPVYGWGEQTSIVNG
jgi:hypothetical protein